MLTEQIAVSQEVDQYAPRRMAAAAAKAKRLWPGVIGDVLADEIMAVLDLPSWMRSQTRTRAAHRHDFEHRGGGRGIPR